MRPASTTAIRPAERTVSRRWAMAMTVRPRVSARTAWSVRRSVSASREAVASSRMTTGASLSRARATEIRCRWPPERLPPPAPSAVAQPSGSPATSSPSWAASPAAITSASVAPGRARRMFSRSVVAKTYSSCCTEATSRASRAGSISRTSTPPMAAISRAMVVLPEPVAPTSAHVVPSGTSRETPCSTSRPASYANSTSSRATSKRSGACGLAGRGSSSSVSISRTAVAENWIRTSTVARTPTSPMTGVR